jgi:hypothetical protein
MLKGSSWSYLMKQILLGNLVLRVPKFFIFCSAFVTINFGQFQQFFDSTHLQVPVIQYIGTLKV